MRRLIFRYMKYAKIMEDNLSQEALGTPVWEGFSG